MFYLITLKTFFRDAFTQPNTKLVQREVVYLSKIQICKILVVTGTRSLIFQSIKNFIIYLNLIDKKI